MSQSFRVQLGLNFNVTHFGQQALLLDTTGTLAALQKQATDGTMTAASGVAMGPISTEDIEAGVYNS